MDQIRINHHYTRLYAVINGCFWMSFCTSVSYASVYLLDKGYSNSEIGIIMAISNILAVILQPMAASFADRHKNLELRKLISVFSGGIVLTSGILVFIRSGSIVLSVLMVFISTMMMILQPLINSLSVAYEDFNITVNFGLARGVGSVSFAVLSTMLGVLLRYFSTTIIPICLCLTITSFTLCVVAFRNINQGKKLAVVKLNQQKEEVEGASSILAFMIHNKRFMVFLIGVFFIFYNHQTISVFTIQIVESYHGTSMQMGIGNSIAAVLEFPAMFFVSRLLKKYSCKTLLRVAAFFFAVKHLILLLATNIPVYYIGQAFQMGSYAVFIPTSVTYVNRLLNKADAVKGQAFVTSAITLGAVFASIISGNLLDVTSVHNVLLIGTVISWVGSAILFFSTEKIE